MNEALTHYGKDNPLVETLDFVPTRVLHEDIQLPEGSTVQEDARPAKRMVLEGVFQRSDVQNLNRRTYPRSVWEKLCRDDSKMQKRISERAMIGHLEHPKDGTTDLAQGAILVLSAKLAEDGTVMGRALVYNTPAGRMVQEYVETGTKFGISSRGTGSVDSKGVVQEDYDCQTWDIVYNPSTPGAYPKPANESTKDATVSTTVIPESVKEDTSKLDDGFTSVEQQILAAGPELIRNKTSITDANSVAMVQWRFQKWARQRGAVDKTVEAAWETFSKVDPLVVGNPPKAATPAGTGPSAPVKVEPTPANGTPAATTVPQPNGQAKLPENQDAAAQAAAAAAAATPAPVVKPPQLDEQGLALLAEARAQVATLTEQLSLKVTELETSAAIVSSLTEDKVRLQAEVEQMGDVVARCENTLAALTAVDVAAQVREAVEAALKRDPRLAAFREVLDVQKTPAAVEARAEKILGTLTESAPKGGAAGKPITESLADRVRRRTTIAENKGLPAAKPAATMISESDAGVGTPEPTGPMSKAQQGAKSVAVALRRGLFTKAI